MKFYFFLILVYKKKYLHIGSCKHSDISTFSLHPVKTITAGEGGLVVTNNKIFYNKIISLRSHGINKDKKFHWKYNIKESGYNYRLSDLNCALAFSQLKRINKFINYRKKIFNTYRFNLKRVNNLISFPFYKEKKSSYHLFLVSIKFSEEKLTKDKLLRFFKSNNILFQYHYIPIYKFKLFDNKVNLKFYKGAETYYKNTISIPIFYNLTPVKQKLIIQKFISFFKEA